MVHLKTICIMLIMLSMLCGIHYYLARGIHHCVQHFLPKFRFIYVILILAVLTVMMFLSIARPFQGVLQRIISTIGAFWMGAFVYLLLFFVVTDLVYLLARLFPGTSQKLLFITRLTAIVLTVCTVGVGFVHANKIHTVHYEVQLTQQSSSNMKIVMLSDLHLGAVRSEARLEKIAAKINEQNPDLVCIAGDIFDNDYSSIMSPDEVVHTLQQISATYGVYACFGNHDAGPEFEKMKAMLERAGIQLLEDEYVIIDEKLILAGRLDASPIGGYNGEKRQALSVMLADADPTLPVIVMDHNPGYIDEYQGEGQLILSGHTHKGQIFPGSLITNAMYTVDYGYYQAEDGTQVIVTSGAGTWGLPIRVGTDCEIVNIDVKY